MSFVVAVLGLFLCFWGGKLVKPALAIVALLAGVALGAWVGGEFGSEKAAWVLGGIGALSAFCLVMFVFKAGLLIIGAVGGTVLYTGAVNVGGLEGQLPQWGLIAAALAGGLLSWLLRKRILAIMTAVVGAYLVVEGVLRMWGGQYMEWGDPPQWAQPDVRTYFWFVLALLGMVVQLAKPKRKKND